MSSFKVQPSSIFHQFLPLPPHHPLPPSPPLPPPPPRPSAPEANRVSALKPKSSGRICVETADDDIDDDDDVDDEEDDDDGDSDDEDDVETADSLDLWLNETADRDSWM